MSKFSNIIANFKKKRILVIGDVILDKHIQGSVSRISPEAPVPIVHQEGEPTYAPGGAANVASNLKSLGAFVTLVGKIGNDEEGKMFLAKLKKNKIASNAIFVDEESPTIVKTRIVAQHQQVLRLDREKFVSLENTALFKRVLNVLRKNIKSYDAVIISDYGKGMICQNLITELCELSQKHGKILTVDPKVEHFGYYRGVTAITPNRREAENAIRNIKITQKDNRRLNIETDQLKSYSDVEKAAKKLLKFLNLDSMLITLGEDGMCLVEKNKNPVHIHTRAQDVYDVTGAGDTVVSVYTLSLASGATKLQAADLANYAAGIVVGKMGVVTVTGKELLDATKQHS